jgi:hypothetical protein
MKTLNIKIIYTLLIHSFLVGSMMAQEKSSIANEPPMIPIGLDAYRMWDRLYFIDLGIQVEFTFF